MTTTKANWSKHDWTICKSDIPDPNRWKSGECGSSDGAPSTSPSSLPTPTSQADCELFFTELADCEDTPYIEIKSSCPGMNISRDLSLVSWQSYGFSYSVDLKGVTIPDDGFFIICSNKMQHRQKFIGKFDIVDGVLRDLSVCDVENERLLAGHGFNSYAIVDNAFDCDKVDCAGGDCYEGCNHKYLDIYGYEGSSLEDEDHEYKSCRAVRKMEYPFGNAQFNPKFWESMCLSYSTIYDQPGKECDPRTWKEVPLVLFFTEFCDPSDDENKRMIELFSPNKRNYKIKDDLIVMKWEGKNTIPSYSFNNLKGHVVNHKGYLVICIDWYAYDRDICQLQTGHANGVTNLSGDEHFALAKCKNPTDDCTYIDMYGTPGIDVSGSSQDFTGGKVFRKRNVPAPMKHFDISHWVVVDDINADQCGAGKGKHGVRK